MGGGIGVEFLPFKMMRYFNVQFEKLQTDKKIHPEDNSDVVIVGIKRIRNKFTY